MKEMTDTPAEANDFLKTGKAKFADEESIRARDILRVWDDVKTAMDEGVDDVTCWECSGSGISPVDDHMDDYYFGDLREEGNCQGCKGFGDRYIDIDQFSTYADIMVVRHQMIEDGNLIVEDE